MRGGPPCTVSIARTVKDTNLVRAASAEERSGRSVTANHNVDGASASKVTEDEPNAMITTVRTESLLAIDFVCSR